MSHIDTESSPEEFAATCDELARRLEEVVPQTDPNHEMTEAFIPKDDGGCFVVRRAYGETVKDSGLIIEFRDPADAASTEMNYTGMYRFDQGGGIVSMYSADTERTPEIVAGELLQLITSRGSELRTGGAGAFYGTGEALPETSMPETEQFEAYHRLQTLCEELCDESDSQHDQSYIPGDSEWDTPAGATSDMMHLRIERDGDHIYITERVLSQQPDGTLKDEDVPYMFNRTGGLIDRTTNRPVPDKALEFAELIELDRQISGNPELLDASEELYGQIERVFEGVEPGDNDVVLVDSRDPSHSVYIHRVVERDRAGMESVRFGILETKESGTKIYTRSFSAEEDQSLMRSGTDKPDARAAARLADIIEHGEEPR